MVTANDIPLNSQIPCLAILQFVSASHAIRMPLYHLDALTRQTMFLQGGAEEIVAVAKHPDVRGSNELVLLRGLSVHPLHFKQWLDTSIHRFAVVRAFFFTRNLVATSENDLVQQLTLAGPPPGPLRVMAFPKTLERRIAECLPEEFILHPVKFSYTLHVVMLHPGKIRFEIRPAEEQFFTSPDGPSRIPDQCCKAAGKLMEALQATGIGISPHGCGIDVGAAPGGWTSQLAKFMQTVVAVDPAELDPSVAALGNVVHVKRKSQDAVEDIKAALGPDGLADLVCCDANSHPGELMELVGPVLKLVRPGGWAIVTLKFYGRGVENKHVPQGYLGAGWEGAKVYWLMANTQHERTLVSRKLAKE